MHGKWSGDTLPPDESFAFVAEAYHAMATIGTGCPSTGNTTMEDVAIQGATRIKAQNASANVGMYYRSDFALELAKCSAHSDEWNSHPDWWLKDDKGNYINKHNSGYMMDFSNLDCAKFFKRVYLYVLAAKLPSGKPAVDYIYMDGAGCSMDSYAPGVGPQRSAAICSGKMAFIRSLQVQLDARGLGQNLLLNGMDTDDAASQFVASGAAGAMFDHWSILQYLNRTSGDFLMDAMEQAFDLATSPKVSNITIQIKGWPGPIVKQRDMYPPTLVQPKTTSEFQRVSGERFNSELALFLLVASENTFWMYSWFWGFNDWVPGQTDSTVGSPFFPEAKCQLGAPLGPRQRVVGGNTYTREFQHASVFVDLSNRTNSHVNFNGSC